MKKIVFAAIFLSLLSCKSEKKAVSESKVQISLSDGCPEKGACTSRIEKDKSIVTTRDEFGKLGYKLEENKDKKVVVFEYFKPGPKGTMDGNYREEILFEINADVKDFTLSGKEFKSSKMIFGVFCYCKEKAGYYNVSGGTIIKSGNVLHITIPDIVDDQKVKTLKIKI